ncbi:hypothetical protein KL86DYS1_20073 [uncultured Dysgonomonas sp.]|uniref:Uncharacterized protein n=1 Tax=uncultured Dysgonomonas sp. TaxID=206096 RepID=A0A212JKN7_9BACT|nr:hypothetical protein KL86DYS1_20073 [uncultured Dysgonomonas sp.]
MYSSLSTEKSYTFTVFTIVTFGFLRKGKSAPTKRTVTHKDIKRKR